jgi:hypothetical protein
MWVVLDRLFWTVWSRDISWYEKNSSKCVCFVLHDALCY